MAYQIKWDTPSRNDPYYKIGGKNYFQGTYNGFNSGGNCTWYAYGRFCEIQGNWNIPPVNAAPGQTDAGNWRNRINSKCASGTVPERGAVAIWYDASNNAKKRKGHVAIVERVNDNGTLLISESGWGSYLFRTSTTHSGGSRGQLVSWMDSSPYDVYKLWGYIYNPAIHGSSAGNSQTGTGGNPSDPPPTDKNHINYIYKPKSDTGSYKGMTTSDMRNNGLYVYLYLRDKGWKIKPICAVLGYLQYHSKFSPVYLIGETPLHVSGGLMPDDEGQGYGMFTWSPSRRLIDYLAQNDYKIGMVDDGSGFMRNYDFKNENDAYGQLDFFSQHTREGIDWKETSSYYEPFINFSTDVQSLTGHSTTWLTRCFIDSWVGLDVFIDENAKLFMIDYAKSWEDYIRGNEIAGNYSIVPGDGSVDSDDTDPQPVYPSFTPDNGPNEEMLPIGNYHKPDNKHLLVARRRTPPYLY